MEGELAPRLRQLPRGAVLGHEVAVATGFRARLLGLSYMDRCEAGAGLLIPHCSAVHTFGMRFALDLVFLDASLEPLEIHRGVGPRRFAFCTGAAAILERPAPAGGCQGQAEKGERSANSARGGGESGVCRDLSGADAAPETRDRKPGRL